MFIDFVGFYLLLDGGCSESKNLWSFCHSWGIFRIEEVSHDKIVQMLLVSVMSLIQDQHVQVFHLNVAVHQEVIKLPCYEYEHVVVAELLDPVLVFIHSLIIFSAYIEFKDF